MQVHIYYTHIYITHTIIICTVILYSSLIISGIAVQADESRRTFVARMLSVLVERSAVRESPVLCAALVDVIAAPCLQTANPAGKC